MPFPTFEEIKLLFPWVWIGAGALILTLVPGIRRSAIVMGPVGAVGVGAALYLSFEFTEGNPPEWPPILFLDRVMCGILGSVVVGIIDSALLHNPDHWRRYLRWIPRGALVTWFLWGITDSPEAGTWSVTETRMWMGSLGAAVLLLMFLTEDTARRLKGPVVAFTIGAMGGVTSLVYLTYQDLALAQYTAVLAGCFTLAGVAGLLFRSGSLPPAALSCSIFTLAAMWTSGRYYASGDPAPPKLHYLLMMLVPLALWLAVAAPSKMKEEPHPKARRVVIAGCVIALGFLSAALFVAVDAAPKFG